MRKGPIIKVLHLNLIFKLDFKYDMDIKIQEHDVDHQEQYHDPIQDLGGLMTRGRLRKSQEILQYNGDSSFGGPIEDLTTYSVFINLWESIIW